MSANSLQPMTTTAIYMPSIFWHDRQGILSIDVLQQKQSIGSNDVPVYKIATASMQKEIRVWNFRINNVSLSVEFLSNLEGHRLTTNVVRFSPNGKYLASGDAGGSLLVWTLFDDEQRTGEKMEIDGAENAIGDPEKKRGDPEMDIPPNKENWVRTFRASMAHHDSEITALCFSPDSQMVASVSMAYSVAVNRADNGKRLWMKRSFRHFANGIVWDPRGKYIVTLSTDRRMDVLEAQKGTLLRSCHQIELPMTKLTPSGNTLIQQNYKLFHDDQLCSFQRGIDFSPCGGIVFAPAAHLEVGANNIYGTFAFRRADLKDCRPSALFPTLRPTIQVKCSPILYELEKGENFLGLPHRVVFAVLCRDSILLYNSQSESPFAYMENLHYDKLTSISWTPDGLILVVSSLEGFNSFINLDPKKLGIPCEQQPDLLAFQQQQQTETLAALALTKTPVKDGNEGSGPGECQTPNVVTKSPTPNLPPYVSLMDSPKLIAPRRTRPKKALDLNTPDKPKNKLENESSQQPMGQSPKTHVPKKKPRKIVVVTIDDDEPPSSSGAPGGK